MVAWLRKWFGPVPPPREFKASDELQGFTYDEEFPESIAELPELRADDWRPAKV